MVEYTLILTLITLGTLVILTTLGGSIRSFLTTTSTELDTAIP